MVCEILLNNYHHWKSSQTTSNTISGCYDNRLATCTRSAYNFIFSDHNRLNMATPTLVCACVCVRARVCCVCVVCVCVVCVFVSQVLMISASDKPMLHNHTRGGFSKRLLILFTHYRFTCNTSQLGKLGSLPPSHLESHSSWVFTHTSHMLALDKK